MEDGFLRRAAAEAIKAAFFCTAFCLLAEALFAVFIRAYAPSYAVLSAVNWGIKCLGASVGALIFVRGDRAFFKGLAAGAVGCFATMLIFGAVGGFHLTPLFLLEVPLMAAVGGAGAVIGRFLRKER
ncbi:MAG: hypothetical protein ACI4NG_04670 [Candidatus Gallimonas sp.]